MILDGKILSDAMAEELKSLAAGKGINLAAILVGNNPDSVKYVHAKQKRAHEIGIKCDVIALSENISGDELLKTVDGLNNDAGINGIMVQLPLPKHIDARIVHEISIAKDVDGMNPDSGFMPATVRGIEKLLLHYGIELAGKNAVVVGEGAVGKPAAEMLRLHGAVVTTCNDGTEDLVSFTRRADILISATGVKDLITPEYIKDGVVIIDVGTGGDVSKNCYPKASAYTPVPGGVGPMTVVSLIENTIRTAL